LRVGVCPLILAVMNVETKVIYHIDDEQTPYLIKLPVPSDLVTLGHFKAALNRPNFKYFFKSVDDDFGVVKEEISDDAVKLPTFNGCVESWLVTSEGSTHSDANGPTSQHGHSSPRHPPTRSSGLGESRPPSFHGGRADSRDNLVPSGCSSETESTLSGLPKFPRYGTKLDRRSFHPQFHERVRYPKGMRPRCFDVGHGLTSDLDSSSFMDSEDDQASRISSSTDITSVSRQYLKRKKRRRLPRTLLSRASSVSSITESSMSLNIITVTLNMDTVNFLGISIVGHSNQLGGDGGIYVGSIMKGSARGAVALDGRIEPGDMILQVNDISFESMSNDDAVRVLREAVQKPGPIKLVVAKCWDPNPKGYFTIPRTEPVRPIDPGAWVAHTNALRAEMPLDYPGPLSVNTGSFTPVPEAEKFLEECNLDVNVHDIVTIVRAMAKPESGLEIRDRTWLKITIPNAFLGSDVVEWLYTNVQGFSDRRDARKYAARMLKEGYIKHTVNKITFAEQCYYVFGDICDNFAGLRLEPHREEPPQLEHDPISALPPPPMTPSTLWSSNVGHPYYPHQACPSFVQTSSVASGYVPIPYQYNNEAGSFPSLVVGGAPPTSRSDANSAGSAGSNGSNESERVRKGVVGGLLPMTSTPGVPLDPNIQLKGYGPPVGAMTSKGMIGPLSPTSRNVNVNVNDLQSDISGSRQSFRMAMGNPCEFFVDVM
ncbi:Segment polarity protein dishevelled -like protein DVL-3, partial [Trichinella zimbabwensis]